MHVAMKAGHSAAAGDLEMRGGDVNLPRKGDGRTAVDLAIGKGEVRKKKKKK